MKLSPLLLGLAVVAVGTLGLLACPVDYCQKAPACDGVTAINCEPVSGKETCASPPCSTGADVRDCPADTACVVHPGSSSSLKYVRTRALCLDADAGACDPATAPPPTCDGNRNIKGCSGYGVVISSSCGEAGLYFDTFACCAGSLGTGDSGTPDGGHSGDDAGTFDAGSPPSSDGGT